MAYMSGTTSSTLSFGQRLAEIKTQMRDALAARRVYRTTKAELDALSDRDLRDLGLSRSMIRAIALEAAYGKAAVSSAR